eukprot:TRINITY_DN2711_c0_g1_i1.p1 TRINITY_DN2711_c0_g1~~TRINITY_DN2711_c0_g1_i1.p1  ORF type:complete len:148 (+),score=48.20 TRINITY_DN2711_c0_g1_i1:16-459(+)
MASTTVQSSTDPSAASASPSSSSYDGQNDEESLNSSLPPHQVPERLYYLSAREKDKLIKRSGKLAFGRCLGEIKTYTDCTSKTFFPWTCWNVLQPMNECLRLARESIYEDMRNENLEAAKKYMEELESKYTIDNNNNNNTNNSSSKQ